MPPHLQEALALRIDAVPSAGAMTLRPYQEACISAVEELERKGVRRSLVVKATGTGKTVTFAEMARRQAECIGHGARVLVIAHRSELLKQARNKIRQNAPGAAVGMVKAARNEVAAPFVVASIQTLMRPERMASYLAYGRPDLVVVDEAHHAGAQSYVEVLRALGAYAPDGPLVVGFTATPNPKDRDLARVFPEVAFNYPMDQAVEEGYLVDVVGLRVEMEDVDLSDVRRSQGDYQAADLGQAMEDGHSHQVVAQAYAEHAAGRRAICFTPLVRNAHLTADAVRAAGFRAVAISGATPEDEREHVYRQLREGELDMVCNAMLLTEGFDEPSVDCVIIARPTQSRGLYVQMVGRGTRLCEPTGKQDCLVLDLMAATKRHSLVHLGALLGAPASRDTGRISMREEKAAQAADAAASARDEQTRMAFQMKAERIALLAKMRWVHVPRGFAMSLPNGDILGMMQVDLADECSWRVGVMVKSGANLRIAEGLTMEYAQGLAEDHARAYGAGRLHDRERATWRNERPYPKALRRARELGCEVPVGATAGEVSDLITEAEVRQAIEAHNRGLAA